MTSVANRPDTRDYILDACDRLMASRGFQHFSVDDLAREAGVSKRTVYVYFHSKREVGLSSIDRVVEAARREMEAIAAQKLPAPERLRKMLERRVMARVLAVQDYHHSLDELFEAVRPEYMARRRDSFDRESALLAGVLEGTPNPDATAESLLLATNAFLPYSLSVRELGQPTEIRRRLLYMIDLLIRGIPTP